MAKYFKPLIHRAFNHPERSPPPADVVEGPFVLRLGFTLAIEPDLSSLAVIRSLSRNSRPYFSSHSLIRSRQCGLFVRSGFALARLPPSNCFSRRCAASASPNSSKYESGAGGKSQGEGKLKFKIKTQDPSTPVSRAQSPQQPQHRRLLGAPEKLLIHRAFNHPERSPPPADVVEGPFVLRLGFTLAIQPDLSSLAVIRPLSRNSRPYFSSHSLIRSRQCGLF